LNYVFVIGQLLEYMRFC